MSHNFPKNRDKTKIFKHNSLCGVITLIADIIRVILRRSDYVSYSSEYLKLGNYHSFVVVYVESLLRGLALPLQ